MKTVLTSLSFLLLLSGCLVDDELNVVNFSTTPQELTDNIVTSFPSNESVDSISLVDIIRRTRENDDLWSVRSMLVFRHGKLITESYFKDDDDITNRQLIWSCTKQIMGVLTGIAIERGLINSIDDPISDYLEEELSGHEEKKNITIRNLLMMNSGIGYSNDGKDGETDLLLRRIPENMLEFILSKPVIQEPGIEFAYNDGDPTILSAIIQKQAGKPTDQWAHEVLFQPLGITNINWVRYKDGLTFGGFGIETTPRELAKFGLMVLNNGKSGTGQLVSSGWIQEMTTSYQTAYESYKFGYYWWKSLEEDVVFTWGHGGQFALLVPEKDLMVVITSIPNTQGDYQVTADEVIPVVRDIVAICN